MLRVHRLWLGSHLGLWLRLRLRLRLDLGLLIGLLLFEEVALAVGTPDGGDVVQVDKLLEVLVACVAVIGSLSSSNLS